MRSILNLVFIVGFVACGKNKKNDSSPLPQVPNNPENPNGPKQPAGEEESFNLAERESSVIQKYKSAGVKLTFWSGQKAKIRDGEIEQLIKLLPEIEKRSTSIKRLEISGYKMHWYHAESKFLQIDLEKNADGAIQYLTVFDKVRAYESRLNGTLLERAGETVEILEGDLAYYERVDLAALMQNRPYIKIIHPSGSMQFIQSRGILYIKADATADQLREKLDGIGRWYSLTQQLSIEIDDKTEDGLGNSFISAVDSLLEKVELIRPVIDFVKKIEITREFSEMTFDLETGVFKFSRFDAANSDDLWLALVDYKRITSALSVPVEIPDFMRDRAEPLRSGLKLVADNLDVIQTRLASVHKIRIGSGEETQLATDQTLRVGCDQTTEQFRAYVQTL
jgi:hypothetical protein